jgi:hypothetical protein
MVGPNLAHSRISLYRIFFVPDDTQTCFPPAAISPCPPAAAAPHLLRRITTVCPGRMECLRGIQAPVRSGTQDRELRISLAVLHTTVAISGRKVRRPDVLVILPGAKYATLAGVEASHRNPLPHRTANLLLVHG